MSEQPEALRLAEQLNKEIVRTVHLDLMHHQSAAELRRLHEMNAELLEALKHAADVIEEWGAYASPYFQNKYDLQGDINKARAAIAKATGEQQ